MWLCSDLEIKSVVCLLLLFLLFFGGNSKSAFLGVYESKKTIQTNY